MASAGEVEGEPVASSGAAASVQSQPATASAVKSRPPVDPWMSSTWPTIELSTSSSKRLFDALLADSFERTPAASSGDPASSSGDGLPPWRRTAMQGGAPPPKQGRPAPVTPPKAGLALPPKADPPSRAPPSRPCLALQKNLEQTVPKEYGCWDEWESPASLRKEEDLTARHDIAWSSRGPVSPDFGGPTEWRGLPFDYGKQIWGFSHRAQLPSSYNFTDWWDAASLDEEADLARTWRIPWDLRGPPNGPVEGRPRTWRSRTWRANRQAWMNRGGANQR